MSNTITGVLAPDQMRPAEIRHIQELFDRPDPDDEIVIVPPALEPGNRETNRFFFGE